MHSGTGPGELTCPFLWETNEITSISAAFALLSSLKSDHPDTHGNCRADFACPHPCPSLSSHSSPAAAAARCMPLPSSAPAPIATAFASFLATVSLTTPKASSREGQSRSEELCMCILVQYIRDDQGIPLVMRKYPADKKHKLPTSSQTSFSAQPSREAHKGSDRVGTTRLRWLLLLHVVKYSEMTQGNDLTSIGYPPSPHSRRQTAPVSPRPLLPPSAPPRP